MKKGDQPTNASFGHFAHFVYTDEGKTESASLATHRLNSEWILNSGASKHVAGCIGEFESYKHFPSTHRETIQTADGTAQQIKITRIVQCTRNIELSSVLLMTHKCRGSIIAFSISKSVEPNEEQKVLINRFE